MFKFMKKLFRSAPAETWHPLSRVPEGFFPQRRPGAVGCEDSALSLSPLWAAVRLYQKHIGSFPLITYRRTPDGGKTPATDHPAFKILNVRPNPAQPRGVMWAFVIKELLLTGNAFITIRRQGDGAPFSLHPIPSSAVTQVLIDDDWNKAYRVVDASGTEVYDDADMIHLVGFSRDGFQGEPIWRYAGESLGLHRQVLEAANSFFANSVRPSVYVRYPGKFDKQALENLKVGLREDYAGTANVGKVPVIEQGGEMTKVNTSTAEDMQVVEAMGASVADVGRWMGLSPIQLNDFDSAHYNTLESDNTYLYQKSLRPVLDLAEQELNFKLFDGEPEIFAEFDIDELLRGDPTSTATIINLGIQGGWLLRSEAREWFGMKPVAGMDTPTVPLNMGGNPSTTQVTPPPQEQNGTADPLD